MTVWRGMGLLYAAGVAVGVAVWSMARAAAAFGVVPVVSPVVLGLLVAAAWCLVMTACLVAATVRGSR